jgi:Carboxypeptidase regulatory-like domain
MVFSQSGTTSVGGTIWDPKGLAVSGADIQLSNHAIGYSRSAQTGPDGVYQFLQLTPGSYKLTVAKEGFSTSEISLVRARKRFE